MCVMGIPRCPARTGEMVVQAVQRQVAEESRLGRQGRGWEWFELFSSNAH